jgi:hypothetical protein
VTDAQQTRQALANPFIGVDEQDAKRIRRCSRVGHAPKCRLADRLFNSDGRRDSAYVIPPMDDPPRW